MRRAPFVQILVVLTAALAAVSMADAEEPGETCNQALTEDVLAALEEMAARDDDPVRAEARPGTAPDTTRQGRAATRGSAAGPVDEVDPPQTPLPGRWLTSRGRQCRRSRGRRVCDGPRRVPRPHGGAADLAEQLGLGSRDAATHLLLHPPRDAWVEAVEGRMPSALRWPVDGGRLWRGFGRVRRQRSVRRRLHKGLDIGAPDGTPIRSVADGIVAYSDNQVTGYGNLMMVVHADGSVAYYAHCRATYLFAGQQVKRGQVLGEVGHTGLARGSHLHFELRIDGRPRNPISRFEETPDGRQIASR